MGKKVIVEKIEKVILNGIREEKDVFYLLGQIRKYFDFPVLKDQTDASYPTFSLIADWILHSSLNRRKAKRKLQEYEQFFRGNDKNATYNFMTSGFTLFKDLRTELKAIFTKLTITPECLENKNEWLNFVSLLYGILQDLPLKSTGEIVLFKFDNGIIKDKDGTKTVSFTLQFADTHSKHFTIDLVLFG